MSPLLDADDLEQLTGFKRPSDQIVWLKRYGITPMITKDQTPSITWSVVDEAMRRLSNWHRDDKRQGSRPNFQKLEVKQ